MPGIDAEAASLAVEEGRRTEFDLAWRHFGEFLNLGSEALMGTAAQRVEAEDSGIAIEPRYRDAYAYLLSARGADAAPYVIPGLTTILALIPIEEMWVRVGESIQDAIDRIPDGGTIYLEPGTYEELLRIDRTVNLVGSEWGMTTLSRPTFDEEESWAATITVDSLMRIEVGLQRLRIGEDHGSVSVKGRAFVRLEGVSVSGSGLWVQDQAEVEGLDCEVRTSNTSLYVSGEGVVHLTRCALIGLPKDLYDPWEDSGITLWGSAQVRLVECQVSGFTGHGIEILHDTHVTIIDSAIWGNGGYGVSILGQSDRYATGRTSPGVGGGSSTPVPFRGLVMGSANHIPGPGAPDGNGLGAVYPQTLEFLVKAPDAVGDVAD